MLTQIRIADPPGPVSRAAVGAWGDVCVLQGPVGSGKTGAFVTKAFLGTTLQRCTGDPVEVAINGDARIYSRVRRARLFILKTDYRRLWENFIPSWLEWVPQGNSPGDKEKGFEWVGSAGGPAWQRATMMLPDGSLAQLETNFMALGDLSSQAAFEDFFAGLQGTWIWFNELQTIPRMAWDYAFQRIGRFPREADGGAVYPGVWGDMNAPVIDTWQHKAIVNREWLPGQHYFRQPGAMDAGAENLPNLPSNYYDRMMRFMSRDEVDRKVHNRFGRRLDGQPVWDFNDAQCVPDSPLSPDASLPLLIGIDAGGSPAAVLAQRRRDMQLRCLDEVISAHGTGPERFGRELGALLDGPKYAHLRRAVEAYGDPSAQYGADRTEGEMDWLQRVGAEAGIRIRPAPTNALKPRLQAVADCLRIEGNVPLLLVSPTCKVLRAALNGGYRWRRLQIANTERYDPEPEKNDHSHVADALQYVALAHGGYERAQGRAPSDGNGVKALLSAYGYAPNQVATAAPGGRLPGRLRGRMNGQRPIILD